MKLHIFILVSCLFVLVCMALGARQNYYQSKALNNAAVLVDNLTRELKIWKEIASSNFTIIIEPTKPKSAY